MQTVPSGCSASSCVQALFKEQKESKTKRDAIRCRSVRQATGLGSLANTVQLSCMRRTGIVLVRAHKGGKPINSSLLLASVG